MKIKKQEKEKKENITNLESNYFYTFNSHLSFEAYDENEQFNFKVFKNFVSNYNYLMNKLKNNIYTFLPLINGVFIISYLKKTTIIIFEFLYNQFKICFRKNFAKKIKDF